MLNKRKISILSFIAVLITIFIVGAFAISLTLSYLENKYIQIQLDVNRRQANTMARFLEEQLNKGNTKTDILSSVQHSLKGTEVEKGFLCLFDTASVKLLCHPNPKMVGMKIPKQFKFDKINGEHDFASDVIKKGKEAAGFFQSKNRVDITYMVPVKGTSWMVSLHENINQIKKEIEKQRQRLLLGAIFFGLIMAILSTFASRKVSGLYERIIENKNLKLDNSLTQLTVLHEKVTKQKQEIEAQRDYVTNQRDKIAHQNKEIKQSIEYASRIQSAMLSSENILNENFPENFIYYRPKDIVSGDFYWFRQFEDTFFIVVADSTGHGVPGAMMSMLGIALLNEIVIDKTLKPAKILAELRNKIKLALKQQKNSGSKDGMDLALCKIDKKNKILEYAGAYNPLFFIHLDEFIITKGDKMPVGIHVKEKSEFTNHEFSYNSGDKFYLFSDGYVDQFGGEKGQKFKIKNFRALLLKINDLFMNEQEDVINETVKWWKGEREQVDDILVTGIEL